MTQHYLVTGGSGFLGINLIRYLLQRGHTVTSLDIAPFTYADVADRIQIITGDIRDRAAVDRAMQGAEIVVHGAAALPLFAVQMLRSTDAGGLNMRDELIGWLIDAGFTAPYAITLPAGVGSSLTMSTGDQRQIHGVHRRLI